MNRATALLLLSLFFLSPASHAATAPAVGDTWVYGASGFQATNFGANPTIRVRASGTRIGFVRFDTNALPPGSPVVLKMRVNTVHVGGIIRIHVVQQAWQERTVTFNTRPAYSSTDLSTRNILASDVGKIVSFDVTSAVAGWRANPATHFGLAIDARSSPADVYFTTREGGFAPFLEGSGGVARDGEVTVSKSGGDYTSPNTAVQNAFEGDRWCTYPTIPACTMRIGAGVFVLSARLDVPMGINIIGAGKGDTTLAGAVAFDSNSTISDLSIILRDTSVSTNALSFSNGAGRAERISVRIEGQGKITAIYNGEGGPVLIASELVVLGGDEAFGLRSVGGAGFTVRNSSIRVAGASQRGVGIEWHTDDGGSGTIENSAVSVEATGRAEGVDFNAEGGLIVSGSRIFARSEAAAAALSSIRNANGFSLEVRDTVLGARGPGGQTDTAVDYGANSAIQYLFDRVFADGSIRISPDFQAEVTMTRSQVSSLEVRVGEAQLQVSIDNSSIAEGLVVQTASSGSLTATSSIIGAPRTFINVSVACTEVYDEHLRLLDGSCRAP